VLAVLLELADDVHGHAGTLGGLLLRQAGQPAQPRQAVTEMGLPGRAIVHGKTSPVIAVTLSKSHDTREV